MFSSLRRALLGLAVIAASTVAVPVATSVVEASSGRIEVRTWAPTTGGFAQFTMLFGSDTFHARAAIETSTGGLMLAGYLADSNNFTSTFAVVRITSTGALDTSFDQDGLKTFVLNGNGDPEAADFIQEAGSNNYFVGGWSGSDPGRKAVMIKMDESGGLANGWGSSGQIVASGDRRYEGSGTGPVGEKSFFVDSQQIVMWSENTAQTHLTIDRFDVATGQLMASGGPISNPVTFARSSLFTGSDKPETFVMTSTSKMLVATRTGVSNDSSALYKIDLGVTPPVLDTSYNTTGKLQTNVYSYHLEDFRFGKQQVISVYEDRIFLAGSSNSNPGPADTRVVRLKTDGTVDTAGYGANPWGGNANNPGYIEILTFNLAQGDFEFVTYGQQLLVSGTGAGLQPEIRKFNTSTAGLADTGFGTQGVQTVASACNVIVGGSVIPITGGSNFFLVGPKANKLGALKFVAPNTALAATACSGTMGNISVSYSAPSYTGTQGQFLNIPAPTVSGSLDDPSNPGDDPLFTLTQGTLPSGVSLSPSSGAISGTPAASTNGTVTLEVTATYNFPNNAGTQTGVAQIILDIAATQGGNPNQPAACVVGAPTVTGTQPVLDTSWGTIGWTTFQVGAGSSYNSRRLVPTSDNAFLLIGNSTGANPSNQAIDIRKFDATGASVSAFGTNGRLLVEVNPARLFVSEIAIDSSGKVYVLASDSSAFPAVAYSIRLTSTGTLDTSYDGDGILSLTNLPGTTFGFGIAASASGDVYVSSSTFANGTESAYISKFSASGRDTNFGNNGNIDVSAHSGRYPVVLADGSLIVAGSNMGQGQGQGQMTLAKYSSAGVLDSSWATSGVATFGNSSVTESVRSVVVSGTDLIIPYMIFSFGQAGPPSSAAGVAKVSATTGAVDTTFGLGGGVHTPLRSGFSDPFQTTVLSDGSIVIAVFAGSSNDPTGGFLRFSSTGQVDAAFDSAMTLVRHGTCQVGPPSIVELGNGSVLFSGTKNQPSFNTPSTEAVVGKFTFGAFTAGTPGGGFSGSGNQNPNNNQNPSPNVPVFTPPTTVPSDPDDDGDEVPTDPNRPNLVTDENRQDLVRAPGQGGAVVDGEVVEVVTEVVDVPAAQVRPERRTPAQVNQIRQAANELVQQFTQQLPPGVESTVQVVATPTGAIIRGLVTDANGNPIDVPAEDVVLMRAEDLVVMVGAQAANVSQDGRFQVPVGSTFGLAGSGFGSGEEGEFVVMSTPTLITEFETSEVGTFDKSGTLPQSIPVGDHTLVVATGTTYAVLGIQVVPVTLPVTGSSNDVIVVFAMFTVVFGALLVRSRRTLLI